MDKYFNYVSNYGIYAMEAIFAVILLGSLIFLLGMVSSHIFDLFSCSKMVNGGWCLFGFVYAGVLVILLFFLMVGGSSYLFCDYLKTVMSS